MTRIDQGTNNAQFKKVACTPTLIYLFMYLISGGEEGHLPMLLVRCVCVYVRACAWSYCVSVCVFWKPGMIHAGVYVCVATVENVNVG